MDIFARIASFLGILFQSIGLLALGVGLGWFVLDAYKQADWQLRISIFLGFAGVVVGLAAFTTPGGLGAFSLGAGSALLVWGFNASRPEAENESSE